MNDQYIDAGFNHNNSYAEQLNGFYVPFSGDKAPAPKLIKLNTELAKVTGLDIDKLDPTMIAAILSGGIPIKGAAPLAQAYAGHQFGGFSPQLGDGRALLLAEVIDTNGTRRDVHLKGSGRTTFSRGGDGKAALGPVLREYLLGEAMHALNVPTTRALAAVTTGEKVMREGLKTGAVLARVASSHLRVGTFEYYAAQGQTHKVKQLADYAIDRHYPELKDSDSRYLGLVRAVADKQAALIAKWMHIGFVHGVMNTDNMTISGETIDYGPCAFIDFYDPSAVFSSIDRQGRYAFANQSSIAQWNLARLAETLLPLIDEDSNTAVTLATEEIKAFTQTFEGYWLQGMRDKLGLMTEQDDDRALAIELFSSMEGQQVDFTLLFRSLSAVLRGQTDAARQLYHSPQLFDEWQDKWLKRVATESVTAEERAAAMNEVNPLYIPRNHKVEEALQAAEEAGNYEPFETLMAVLAQPFTERDGLEEFALPAPAGSAPYRTFCGT
ncbi:protein adenylyltransferase SelO [Alkalimarinus sediminis]|uniref:Protein nucleotidyltransferase YdiU n=1 Tax=Alkalimarinus sediminis TaxID=1632866 RepID=A0A9E8HKG2_9ALTE|nr:YdiU family protein [Alkalimarinus sediminis]UZW76303.1 YdiU family protein [Alkalimarinus sediminis]